MKPSPDAIERLVHGALRALPDRRAPATLEARVRAEIARQAGRPWWRRSYLQWPPAGRGAFFVLSAAAAAALVAGLFQFGHSPESARTVEAIGRHFGWLASARAVGAGGWRVGAALYRAIPPLWIEGVLAVMTACYATLIGVAAAAYRGLCHRT